MGNKAYGVDLGTKTLKIYKENQGIVVNEKNIIALNNDSGDIMAIGDEAYEMYEKAPENIMVTFPMRAGVIAEFSNMQNLIRIILTKSVKGFTGNKDFYIAVPTDITEVEKRAFLDLIESAKLRAKRVYMVEKPIAAAVGAGLDVKTPNGTMLVDMGAETTEISIMSLGGIVISKLVQIGGNKFDEDIVMNIKKNQNVIIGMKTAEECKMKLASAMPDMDASHTVMGRDLVTGLPVSVTVTGEMVYDSIKDDLNIIMDSIKMILEHTPPEISSDIIDNGVCVTGGCSKISRLGDLLEQETELKANFYSDAQNAVVNGLGRIIEEKELQELAFSLNQAGYN